MDDFFLTTYQLYYKSMADSSIAIEKMLSGANLSFETFPIKEHMEEYDHSDGSGQDCFCKNPDYDDERWPKLHKGGKVLVAAGEADILALDISKL